MKILLADDSKLIHYHIGRALKEWGYEVVSALDGEEAWRILCEQPDIELAIFDWNMPGIEGVELCTKVRQERRSTYLYIILLTAQNGTEHLVTALNCGADDYVTKSENVDELESRLKAARRIVDLQRSLLLEQKKLESANRELHETTSQLKRNEQALSQLVSEQEKLLETMPTFCITVDSAGNITTWNRAATDLFHLEKSSVVSCPLRSLSILWDWDLVEKALLKAGLERTAVNLNHLILHENSSRETRILDMIITPLGDSSSCGTALLILGKDVTERQSMERALAQRSQIESIGQLAAGLAHEINTPIQYVRDNTEFLKSKFEVIAGFLKPLQRPPEVVAVEKTTATIETDQAELEYLLSEIPLAIEQTLEGAIAVARIVHSMKLFSHPGSNERTHVSVNDAIRTSVDISRNEWKDLADVELVLDETLPSIQGFPAEVNQAILNLIINAAEAIRAKGDTSSSKGAIRVSSKLLDSAVAIYIEDSGCGIPANIQNKIFDPFFTTKEVGKGTGQGLSVVYSTVVERHGGTIDFNSKDGQGCTFIMTLPISPPVIAAPV